ncbi:hypothetical protein GCM10010201_10100 [Pilimelia columellifera subsp. columellifera]|uniref:Chlorophyllase n=1 Tax=Pilimelia columellifera subsp. columellifera TaxID=706583 RepID=A0ABN3N7G3_9ACTN
MLLATGLAAALIAGCDAAAPASSGQADAAGGASAGRSPGGRSPGAAGPGASADAASVAPTTAPRRRHAVGVRQLAVDRGDRSLPTTIWYPAGRAGRDATAAEGRFPVVLFSHGLGGEPADYRPLLSRFAQAGFVVAAPAYPRTRRGSDRDPVDVLNQPLDASRVLDVVLSLDNRRGDGLRGRLDTGRVAAAGHSAGGMTTIGMFTLTRDDRLRAGVVMAGGTLGINLAYGGAATPLLFVHGQRDQVVPYDAGRRAFQAVPWPKAMLTLPEGDHGEGLGRGADDDFEAVADFTVEFLRWGLYRDPSARDNLRRAAASGTAGPTLDDRL